MKKLLFICLTLTFAPYFVQAQYDPKSLEKAEETIEIYKEKNDKFELYFADAYGYIVFPSLGKGGAGLGAAFGVGTVFELGDPIGKAKLTQISFGLQFGGQAYSQIIFFATEDDLIRFKKNKIQLTAQASAVALKEGASADLAYHEGVAIFTKAKGGLMYEASFAGHKLKFKPSEKWLLIPNNCKIIIPGIDRRPFKHHMSGRTPDYTIRLTIIRCAL